MLSREIFTLVAEFCFSPQNIFRYLFIISTYGHLRYTETNVVSFVQHEPYFIISVRHFDRGGVVLQTRMVTNDKTTTTTHIRYFFSPEPFNGFFLYCLNT